MFPFYRMNIDVFYYKLNSLLTSEKEFYSKSYVTVIIKVTDFENVFNNTPAWNEL